jgi:hypothetical protein
VSSSIREAKERHAAELMSLAGVIAVGIGKGLDGNAAIVVSVKRGDTKTASRVPSRIEGHPVLVRFTDELRAL